MKNFDINTIIVAVIFGALAGALVSFTMASPSDPIVVPTTHTDGERTTDELMKDFYATETAVHVSPHHIRKGMAKGDESFVLIDLRSQEEYEEEHIIGAVSVPAYKDRDHSDYGAVERITNSVRELREQNPDKDLIVYCYSIPCMTGRKVGDILAKEGIYVQQLGVGWNEWRYYWTLWNHPHEWNQTNVTDYTATGPEPGVFEANLTGAACPIEGSLGC